MRGACAHGRSRLSATSALRPVYSTFIENTHSEHVTLINRSRCNPAVRDFEAALMRYSRCVCSGVIKRVYDDVGTDDDDDSDADGDFNYKGACY